MKAIKKFNQFINENKKINTLEDILQMEFVKKYLTDDFDYTEDSDFNQGYDTLMLEIPAKYVTFDIRDEKSEAFAELLKGFEAFCKENDLYEPEVTTTADYSTLVFAADTDMVDVRESIKEDGLGINLRSLLDGELALAMKNTDFNNYKERNDFITKIEDRLMENDWISLSDGTTFDKSFTPTKK